MAKRKVSEQTKKARLEYWRSHPDQAENKRLKCVYGITLEDRNKMAEKQNGRCAVCGNAEKLYIDHNHETGKVRELLCHKCNIALAFLKENPETIQSLKDYILRHNT